MTTTNLGIYRRTSDATTVKHCRRLAVEEAP